MLRQQNDKRFDVGYMVSGSFGEMGPNPNPNIPRCVQQRIYGNIIEAVGPKQYKAPWDDCTIKEHFSNSLKKKRSFASLPPDVRPPRLQGCLLKASNELTKSKNKSTRTNETKRWRSIFLGQARNQMMMVHREKARGATRSNARAV